MAAVGDFTSAAAVLSLGVRRLQASNAEPTSACTESPAWLSRAAPMVCRKEATPSSVSAPRLKYVASIAPT